MGTAMLRRDKKLNLVGEQYEPDLVVIFYG